MDSDLQAQLDRLAARLGMTRGMGQPALAPPARRATTNPIETLVPGRVIETPHGPCFAGEARYAGRALRSRYSLADCLGQPLDTLAALYPEANLDEFDFARAAFLDTETSGLGGGVGTYAFMVGVGTFEAPASPSGADSSAAAAPEFVVRQFFMRNESEERALLHVLAAALDACRGVVTFNGRAFDLPLLSSRFILHRQQPRLLDAPHLDLLHPARRVWRQRLSSCALGSLETHVLGLRRAQADVPGWLIPSLYFHYLQTGDGRELAGVFYHNLEDILSMVTLAATLTRLLADPWAGETVHALDMAALGWMYEQAGRHDEAERAYRRALAGPLADDARQQTYSRLGQLLKRQERWPAAAEIWQTWLTHVRRGANPRDLEPYLELAKYCEWRSNDLDGALMWTGWAEHEAAAWPRSAVQRETLAGLRRRQERLVRKQQLGRAGASHASGASSDLPPLADGT